MRTACPANRIFRDVTPLSTCREKLKASISLSENVKMWPDIWEKGKVVRVLN